MMTNENWGKLESLTIEAQKSVKEFSESTRAGAGSPIERRMADSFTDIAALLVAQGEVMGTLADQQRCLNERLVELMDATQLVNNNANSIQQTIVHEADIAISNAMNKYEGTVRNLQTKADLAIETLNKIDCDVTTTYQKAVDQNVKRLTRATSAVIVTQAIFAILGGIFVSIGAFFVYQVFPPLQEFVKNNGFGSLLIILIAIAFLLYFAVRFITRDQ